MFSIEERKARKAASAKRYIAAHPEKMRADWRRQSKKWRAANPDKHRAIKKRADTKWKALHPQEAAAKERRRNLRRYGLTPSSWDARFAKQGNRCAACGTEDTGQWNVDHNHTTGEVRGILCSPCNVALGYLEREDQNTLLRVYLEEKTWRVV